MNHTLKAEVLTGGLTVRPTVELDYLTQLLRDPAIYARVADDGSMPLDAIDLSGLRELSGWRLLQVERDGTPVGCSLLLPAGERTWDVHTIFGPDCRGRHAWRAARIALRQVFEDTDCERLISRCPEDNPQSLIFALTNGFRITGRKDDWRKDGKLLSSTHVELTRAMWKGTTCQR